MGKYQWIYLELVCLISYFPRYTMRFKVDWSSIEKPIYQSKKGRTYNDLDQNLYRLYDFQGMVLLTPIRFTKKRTKQVLKTSLRQFLFTFYV